MLFSVGRRSGCLPERLPAAPPRRADDERTGLPVTVLDEIVSDQLRTDLPEIASGDTVKVSAKVV